jgi:nanoRNase/pAp phosphatase (c-di-AMP/oligoRNAs hydrolase)
MSPQPVSGIAPPVSPLTDRLDRLLEAVRGAEGLVILTHNDPDPDAIAAAVALRFLLAERAGLQAQPVYRGIVGRAENRALVRYLNYPLRRLTGADLRGPAPFALVDTQPGAGNNALPPGTRPLLVLDHHPLREPAAEARFADVRPDIGASSTMLAEYLQAARLEPPAPLATALFYGIQTDTQNLTRGATPADVAAYTYLQPRIDMEGLVEIERAQVPAEYFKGLVGALRAARVYNNVVIAYVGPMARPDLAAEMADLLLRLKGVSWAVCMGSYKDVIVLAVRTLNRNGHAERLVSRVVGDRGTAGGHGRMAGGHVRLDGADPRIVARQLVKRTLRCLNVPDNTPAQRII